MQENTWSDFWQKKWELDQIRFHQSMEEALLSVFPQIQNEVILLPLCGKSLDLVYFANLGNQVVGIELSEIACLDFFRENEIEFLQKRDGAFMIFESEKITLYCGDFFKIPKEYLSAITAVYDRAALIALPAELRREYVKALPSARLIFLIALEYESATPHLPPFSVSEGEIRTLYGEHYTVEKLSSEIDSAFTPHTAGKRTSSIQAVESAYLLRLKE